MLQFMGSLSDWGQEEKGTTEDEMAGWHHRLDGHEFGSLSQEDPLKKAMATHSSILAWRVPWMGSLGATSHLSDAISPGGVGGRMEGKGQALVTSWQLDEVVCLWVLRLEMGGEN